MDSIYHFMGQFVIKLVGINVCSYPNTTPQNTFANNDKICMLRVQTHVYLHAVLLAQRCTYKEVYLPTIYKIDKECLEYYKDSMKHRRHYVWRRSTCKHFHASMCKGVQSLKQCKVSIHRNTFYGVKFSLCDLDQRIFAIKTRHISC